MKFRKGTYDDVNSIYQSLSDAEKEYVTPGRKMDKRSALLKIATSYRDYFNAGLGAMTMGSPSTPRYFTPGTNEISIREENKMRELFKGLLTWTGWAKYAQTVQPQASASAPAKPPAPAKTPQQFRPSQRTIDFSNNVTSTIKKRFGGTPGVDYDDRVWTSPSDAANHTYFDKNLEEGLGTAAFYASSDDSIHLRESDRGLRGQINFLHEAGHYLTGDGSKRGDGFHKQVNPGISAQDEAKLKAAYGFGEENLRQFYPDYDKRPGIAEDEAHSTNLELQRTIYSIAAQKLGHNPSYEEFAKYVKQMPDEELREVFDYSDSAYLGKRIENLSGKHYPVGQIPTIQNGTNDHGLTMHQPVETVEQLKQSRLYKRNPWAYDGYINSLKDGVQFDARDATRAADKKFQTDQANRGFDKLDKNAVRKALLEVANTGRREAYPQMNQSGTGNQMPTGHAPSWGNYANYA